MTKKGPHVADRKNHRRMTGAEHARHSESLYSRQSSTPLQSAHQPETSRRQSAQAPKGSRYEGVDAYAKRRKKSGRKHVLIGVLSALVVVIVGVGVAAALYIANINDKINENITPEIRDQLTSIEPQEPFYMLLLGVDKSEGRSEKWGDDAANFRADTIILARVDPPAQKVVMLCSGVIGPLAETAGWLAGELLSGWPAHPASSAAASTSAAAVRFVCFFIAIPPVPPPGRRQMVCLSSVCILPHRPTQNPPPRCNKVVSVFRYCCFSLDCEPAS